MHHPSTPPFSISMAFLNLPPATPPSPSPVSLPFPSPYYPSPRPHPGSLYYLTPPSPLSHSICV